MISRSGVRKLYLEKSNTTCRGDPDVLPVWEPPCIVTLLKGGQT